MGKINKFSKFNESLNDDEEVQFDFLDSIQRELEKRLNKKNVDFWEVGSHGWYSRYGQSYIENFYVKLVLGKMKIDGEVSLEDYEHWSRFNENIQKTISVVNSMGYGDWNVNIDLMGFRQNFIYVTFSEKKKPKGKRGK